MKLESKNFSIFEDVVVACTYNHNDRIIIEGLEYIVDNLKKMYHTDDYIKIKRPLPYDEEFDDMWGILVCIFGDYGTSPRYGWINCTLSGIRCIKAFTKEYKEVN